MLLLSASGRRVHYLPPAGGRGVVILGTYGTSCQRVQLQHQSLHATHRGISDFADRELLDYACLVVGFFVDEEEDLGGWTILNTERQGETGEVDIMETRNMEMFSWQDNVDLEGICDICNGLLLCLLVQTIIHRLPFLRTTHRPTKDVIDQDITFILT